MQDVRATGYLNGKRAVTIIIFRQPGANIIGTVDRIRAQLPFIKASIPLGIDATIAFIDAFFGICESLTIEPLHLAVRGNVVLTERIDTFLVGDRSAPLPVMGTFELRDGKIAAWRDYFDLGQITAMLSEAT